MTHPGRHSHWRNSSRSCCLRLYITPDDRFRDGQREGGLNEAEAKAEGDGGDQPEGMVFLLVNRKGESDRVRSGLSQGLETGVLGFLNN